jgi:F0F1-type ATP synthase membrane subunit a
VAELAHRGLWALALAVLVMNLPFGFWRAGVRRFTRSWFVAVHAPVPFVILLRVVSGLGWHLVSFPVLIGAFFTGQFLGGALRRRR